jgi:hypothetical protein
MSAGRSVLERLAGIADVLSAQVVGREPEFGRSSRRVEQCLALIGSARLGLEEEETDDNQADRG